VVAVSLMFNLQGKDSEKYFKEVENKLLEETDYELELAQGVFITQSCKQIANLSFPKYYPELSSKKTITMDWMQGEHLSEFTAHNKDQSLGNKIGQTLWDFYLHQIHHLHQVHADPHPGNFLVAKNQNLIAIDFGCIKILPDEFYYPYFQLENPEIINNPVLFKEKMYQLEVLRTDDTPKEIDYITSVFHQSLSLFMKPFQGETFDFSNIDYFDQISALGEGLTKDAQLRKMNGNRGSQHFIYISRTIYGLYSLLHDLKATINTKEYKKYKI
jgi:predicted unusual protein kinase regulating ubiquinone biosynthesis (AarF/ABC1/UbiB family)